MGSQLTRGGAKVGLERERASLADSYSHMYSSPSPSEMGTKCEREVLSTAGLCSACGEVVVKEPVKKSVR